MICEVAQLSYAPGNNAEPPIRRPWHP
jgi:hypothetical protein